MRLVPVLKQKYLSKGHLVQNLLSGHTDKHAGATAYTANVVGKYLTT